MMADYYSVYSHDEFRHTVSWPDGAECEVKGKFIVASEIGESYRDKLMLRRLRRRLEEACETVSTLERIMTECTARLLEESD